MNLYTGNSVAKWITRKIDCNISEYTSVECTLSVNFYSATYERNYTYYAKAKFFCKSGSRHLSFHSLEEFTLILYSMHSTPPMAAGFRASDAAPAHCAAAAVATVTNFLGNVSFFCKSVMQTNPPRFLSCFWPYTRAAVVGSGPVNK